MSNTSEDADFLRALAGALTEAQQRGEAALTSWRAQAAADPGESSQLEGVQSVLKNAARLLLEYQQNASAANERKLIHDIASPVATALFVSDSLSEMVQQRAGAAEADKKGISDLYAAVDAIRILLHARRETLIKRGIPSAHSG